MVRDEKIREVEELKKLIEKYPVIGVIDMFKLPSKQLQEIKKKISGKTMIKMSKKSMIKLAIKNAKKENISKLEELIPQQPALVFTTLEPFKFYKMISQLKSPSPAKEGDIAISDILVSAGPTSLLPGPVISELSKAGIPAGVEEGKVAVKKDVVVAKKGEKIKKELASVLRKLGIEPMEVSLNVVAIYENGSVYDKDVLNLVNVYPEKIGEAFNRALNLSVNISYPTKENIKFLLVKAFNSAKALRNLVK
ncbi:MAG: 50S ribosomal protein L10 [Candidatus Aenigmarchaeota archaeon]|nr:50S ribosomal protein L10 [Candidatus Aenigmarchaeota archaeon]